MTIQDQSESRENEPVQSAEVVDSRPSALTPYHFHEPERGLGWALTASAISAFMLAIAYINDYFVATDTPRTASLRLESFDALVTIWASIALVIWGFRAVRNANLLMNGNTPISAWLIFLSSLFPVINWVFPFLGLKSLASASFSRERGKPTPVDRDIIICWVAWVLAGMTLFLEVVPVRFLGDSGYVVIIIIGSILYAVAALMLNKILQRIAREQNSQLFGDKSVEVFA